ncbi:hypothetical protein MAR_000677 [Mya arenaria]|uniref:Uncharacterized protein n=1 Tax=Mya arenaria TaxID=6604 RepID=A0ABY7FBT7_MYAAR|nr:hypothetical protein MAR_000677 [Mya arenaria]
MTAFIVDMFMYEYTIQKDGKVDSTVEKKIKELGLGIDAETGLEISQPMSDEQMSELMEGNNIKLPPVHPWIEKSTPRGFRNAEIRFSTFSSYVNKRKSSIPTLNKFDGIRFHIKKKGWTKIEVLLQQLYDGEGDVDTTIDFKDRSEENKAKTMLAKFGGRLGSATVTIRHFAIKLTTTGGSIRKIGGRLGSAPVIIRHFAIRLTTTGGSIRKFGGRLGSATVTIRHFAIRLTTTGGSIRKIGGRLGSAKKSNTSVFRNNFDCSVFDTIHEFSYFIIWKKQRGNQFNDIMSRLRDPFFVVISRQIIGPGLRKRTPRFTEAYWTCR